MAGLNIMSPAQSRAARGMLGWSEADLAAKVGLAEQDVRAFESGAGDPPSGQIEALRSSLMAAGIVFREGNENGVGLRQTGGDEGTRLGSLTTENDH
ncbi:helix-turn-helix domain-containing protein [Methylobacterium marchantiae]|uniref:Multiprotein-bridging factor 1 family protein n=1 Tax=Methylobacterium marchantiae TaxID=600331 RepID=A0ABW3WVF6_9HYPH